MSKSTIVTCLKGHILCMMYMIRGKGYGFRLKHLFSPRKLVKNRIQPSILYDKTRRGPFGFSYSGNLPIFINRFTSILTAFLYACRILYGLP